MIMKFARGSLIVLVLVFGGCGKSNPFSDKEQASPTPTPAKQAISKSVAATPKTQQPRKEDPSMQSLQARRKNLIAEITAITGSGGGELTTEQWQKVKSHYWQRGFDQPIHNSSAQPSVEGLLQSNSPKEPLIEQLATGKFTSINNQDEQQALIALHLLAMMNAGAGGRTLPNAISDRLDQTPIKGDLYLFDIFSDAFVEVDKRDELVPGDLAAWKNVATASNPIYRLLALQTFRRITADPSQKLDFYKSYLRENDPSIVNEVVSLAVQTSDPKASELLSSLKANPNVSSDPELAKKIDRSIEWLKSLPPIIPPSQ